MGIGGSSPPPLGINDVEGVEWCSQNPHLIRHPLACQRVKVRCIGINIYLRYVLLDLILVPFVFSQRNFCALFYVMLNRKRTPIVK